MSTDDQNINYVEIWRGKVINNIVGYCFSQEFKINGNKIGQFSFADIDRNGYIDLIFPISGTVPTLGIALNIIPVDVNWDEDYCSQHLGQISLPIFNIAEFSENDPNVRNFN